MSLAGDSNLTLKLTQLHTFFSEHLATYKEQCAIPDPPSALILEPQTIQVYTHGHTQYREVFVVGFWLLSGLVRVLSDECFLVHYSHQGALW